MIVEYSQWGSEFVENFSEIFRMEYSGAEGYSVRNLIYMKQFALRIPSEDILHLLGAKISWKVIKMLIDKTESLNEHLWYTQQCIEHGWPSAGTSER